MLKDKSGNKTRLQAGDIMIVDTDDEMIRFMRDGEMLIAEGNHNEEGYWMMPQDGVQINVIAQMIADLCGFSFEELNGQDYSTFRFSD